MEARRVYMDKHWKKVIGLLCFGMMSTMPFTAFGDMHDGNGAAVAAEADADHVEMIPEGVPIAALAAEDESEKAGKAQGSKVFNRTEEGKAAQESARLAKEREENKAATTALAETMLAAAEAQSKDKTTLRQKVVDYALSFVGGPYRYGGNDPRTGVDCSGFTRFVLGNAAGISLPRSSGSQATQGIPVSPDQMQPGDLLFYSGGGGINHVAMYIGSGKVVHASTYETGIIVSNWNYRNPVRIVNVIG